MGVERRDYISISCDNCGTGYDDIGVTVQEVMKQLKKDGWKGTSQHILCPKCVTKES